MQINNYLYNVLVERLDEHRILVWYDGECAFGDFATDFKATNTRVVSGAHSSLMARQQADRIYRQIEESPQSAEARANLLIYIPHSRAHQDQRTQDPFEVFAAAGATFGTVESEQLQSLARTAMPELVEQIDTLFLGGRPTLEMLNRLKLTSAYPLIEEALGTQSAVEVCCTLFSNETALSAVDKTRGARAELLKLFRAELGFDLPSKTRTLRTVRDHLASYILLSEFAFDLPETWPASLTQVPHADLKYRERIYAICDRLRALDDTREVYVALANQIEHDFKLRSHFQGVTRLGTRDTFAFEERQYLANLDVAVQSNDLSGAREIVDGRRRSVWRHLPERAQVWQVAERCLDLLEVFKMDSPSALTLLALIDSYTRADGRSELDRQQRLMEQSCADCTECGEVTNLIEVARRRYRETIDRMQSHFAKQVQSVGWPPEGVLRQTQVFDRFVAPALERREKIGYILADSLRFEMGQALAKELESLGTVHFQPAAAALPTVTFNGMAALMPGADGVLSLHTVGDTLVPYIGERRLKDSDDRMAYLAEKYGDRFVHIALSDWLDHTDKKRSALASRADLLVLRVPDIDELGEHVSLRQARKHMSDLLGELKAAIVQLARLGFKSIVVSADHGHVLLPEVLPGDTATAPEGNWSINKRRVKLGSTIRERPGSLVFKSSLLGIQTDAQDFCVPVGFSVYASGTNYFHEGLSLQECIVPVLELRPIGRPESGGKQQQIEIRYGKGKFTSQVIGLKIYYGSMFNEPLRIRLEAFDAAEPKGVPIGEAADCAARDENTHEVNLAPNTETDVPLLIDPDFKGNAIEIRATAPDTAVVWHRLKLKNAILD